MWMKTLHFPHMIFIRLTPILRIAESTEPQSTKIIPSRGWRRGARGDRSTAKKYGMRPAPVTSAVQRPLRRSKPPCWQRFKRVSTSFPRQSGYSAAW